MYVLQALNPKTRTGICSVVEQSLKIVKFWHLLNCKIVTLDTQAGEKLYEKKIARARACGRQSFPNWGRGVDNSILWLSFAQQKKTEWLYTH
jgi:hypothetical protein